MSQTSIHTAEQLLRELYHSHATTNTWQWEKTQLPSKHEKQKLQQTKQIHHMAIVIGSLIALIFALFLIFKLHHSGLSPLIIGISLLYWVLLIAFEMRYIRRINAHLNARQALSIQYTLRTRATNKQAKGLSAGMGVTVSLDYTTFTAADWQHILPSGGQDAIQQLAQHIRIKLQ